MRLAAPWFGQSEHVWANAVGVILLALALGQVAGGRVADRGGGAAATSLALTLAALFAAASGLLGPATAAALAPFDVGGDRPLPLSFWGSLAATAALAAPAAFALGAVPPLLVHGLSRHARAGAAAGLVSATGHPRLRRRLRGDPAAGDPDARHEAHAPVRGRGPRPGGARRGAPAARARHPRPRDGGSRGSEASGGRRPGPRTRRARRGRGWSRRSRSPSVLGLGTTAVEFASARALAPRFGLSNPVWATQVAVVLAGLAVGAVVGGRWVGTVSGLARTRLLAVRRGGLARARGDPQRPDRARRRGRARQPGARARRRRRGGRRVRASARRAGRRGSRVRPRARVPGPRGTRGGCRVRRGHPGRARGLVRGPAVPAPDASACARRSSSGRPRCSSPPWRSASPASRRAHARPRRERAREPPAPRPDPRRRPRPRGLGGGDAARRPDPAPGSGPARRGGDRLPDDPDRRGRRGRPRAPGGAAARVRRTPGRADAVLPVRRGRDQLPERRGARGRAGAAHPGPLLRPPGPGRVVPRHALDARRGRPAGPARGLLRRDAAPRARARHPEGPRTDRTCSASSSTPTS